MYSIKYTSCTTSSKWESVAKKGSIRSITRLAAGLSLVACVPLWAAQEAAPEPQSQSQHRPPIITSYEIKGSAASSSCDAIRDDDRLTQRAREARFAECQRDPERFGLKQSKELQQKKIRR